MQDISPYILAIAVGWTLSQLIKTIIASVHHKTLSLRAIMFVSGGMPSSHSATIIAVWTLILLKDGWMSGLFGLASAVALVFLYDAVKVRRSSGEQGIALRALIVEQKSQVPFPRVALGHTPLEVVIGSLIGFAVGASIYYLTI